MTGFQITIAKVMRDREWSMKHIADKAGISDTTLGNYMTGRTKSPGMDVLIKLADALDMSLDELVGRKRK